MEKTKIYASYDSNTNINKMKLRCPTAKLIGTGILKDYKLTFRGKYKGVLNIEPFKGSQVPVVLWEITKECEDILDIYQDVPNIYIKNKVKISLPDEQVIKAMTYILREQYKDMIALPGKEYFQDVLEGYSQNNLDIQLLKTAQSECILGLLNQFKDNND